MHGVVVSYADWHVSFCQLDLTGLSKQCLFIDLIQLIYHSLMVMIHQGHEIHITWTNEPPHDETNKLICALSEDSDQPGHTPGLISLRCLHDERLCP